MERVHKGGAKFDYEKAKWFNQQHIQRADNKRLALLTKPFFDKEGIATTPEALEKAIAMTKERCQLLADFVPQARFFFEAPSTIDIDAIKGKWTAEKTAFFNDWSSKLNVEDMDPAALEASFGDLATAAGLKKGEVMLPLRIMLVGGKFGPGVFDILSFIGTEATQQRVATALAQLQA
jgi:glutamyl-tRNA synthetase